MFQQGQGRNVLGRVKKYTSPNSEGSMNELGEIEVCLAVYRDDTFELVRLSGEVNKAAQRLAVRSCRRIRELSTVEPIHGEGR